MPESPKHRHAFERYFRLGVKRSIEHLHAALEAEGDAPSLRTLYEWSRTYDWQDRLADIEREARAAEREGFVEEIREMDRRHVQEALLLQQKGTEWLTGIDVERVTPATAIRAIEAGVRLERAARGADKKIDITQMVRDMAFERGFDPDEAVREADAIVRRMQN